MTWSWSHIDPIRIDFNFPYADPWFKVSFDIYPVSTVSTYSNILWISSTSGQDYWAIGGHYPRILFSPHTTSLRIQRNGHPGAYNSKYLPLEKWSNVMIHQEQEELSKIKKRVSVLFNIYTIHSVGFTFWWKNCVIKVRQGNNVRRSSQLHALFCLLFTAKLDG
jgi:hypothetical protein